MGTLHAGVGQYDMGYLARAAIFTTFASGSLALDLATKAIPHSSVVGNYTRMPTGIVLGVAALLVILGVSQTTLVAIGAGLMLGGLAGNGGQILLEGYASDWIPIGGWLTNIADVSGALGFVCCCAGYLRPVIREAALARQRTE